VLNCSLVNGELNARARKILYAAVTEFIATGEPVGSRTRPPAASRPTARSASSSTA
jgi:transcriptional regulator of heat shock response